VTSTETATETPFGCDHPRPTFLIYPNPSMGAEKVKVRGEFCRSTKRVNLVLWTVAGRRVAEYKYGPQEPSLTEWDIDLKDDHGDPLANGLYYMTITTPQCRSTLKLFVLR
jgi:hypothetical protein